MHTKQPGWYVHDVDVYYVDTQGGEWMLDPRDYDETEYIELSVPSAAMRVVDARRLKIAERIEKHATKRPGWFEHGADVYYVDSRGGEWMLAGSDYVESSVPSAATRTGFPCGDMHRLNIENRIERRANLRHKFPPPGRRA